MKKTNRTEWFSATFFFAVFAISFLVLGAVVEPVLATDLRGSLRASSFEEAGGQRVLSTNSVKEFYRNRAHQAAWSNSAHINQLQEAIESAGAHGLAPADYHKHGLAAAVAGRDALSIEILATDAYITLGAHLLRGKVDPVSVEPNWTAKRRSTDLRAHLSAAVLTGEIRQSLEALEPTSPSYKALQQALRKYTEPLDRVAWPSVPSGPALKPGMRGTRVAALRRRLAAEGWLPPGGETQGDLFDASVETAVAAFQRRIGLEADGVVGALTIEQLNRGAGELREQLRANLERWRWLPENLGSKHIRVNIAEFRLEAWSDGTLVRAHDTIIGRRYRKTPVFSDNVAYVVFNPWWETPRNIARLDKLPTFTADPASVDRLGYEVLDLKNKRLDPSTVDWENFSPQHFPFRIRQKPGPENALGVVKVMFPNRHNVYLHDTPSRELFGKSRRDFSSGCIRVESILDLVEWMMVETPGWDRAKIDATIANGRELRVNLVQKIPVHILYATAVHMLDGGIRFLPDIYDRDRSLIAALNERAK